jgi:hypothetical protein
LLLQTPRNESELSGWALSQIEVRTVRLNLIWTLTPQSLAEADWIHWLFQDFEIVDHVAPRWELFENNSIYILSGAYSQPPNSFMDGIRGVHGRGMFHLSDESFAGNYDIYSKFDFVLRNYYSALFSNPGIKTVPLGYTNSMIGAFQTRPATDRRLLWSFAGSKGAARLEMFKNFKDIEPYECYLYDRNQRALLHRAQYRSLLSESVFAPCPMGNTVLESFRIYESLEMGCIPIVERRRWMPYYDRLMPGHPLPSFSTWRDAREFIKALSSDRLSILRYQRDIAEWWQKYKIDLRKDVNLFVALGLKGAFRSSLAHDWRCQKAMNHQVWRVIEILKHASQASLHERIGITTRRILARAWAR